MDMKISKKMNVLFVLTFIVICISGCGKAGTTGEPTADKPESGEIQQEENTESPAEGTTQIANPWRASSESEIEELTGAEIILPDGSTETYYQVMNDGEICEVDFKYMDLSFVYRLKKSEEFEDISGMYYKWDYEEEIDFHGCTASAYRCITDEETADLFQWYDGNKGIMYSLGTTAKDLDGFDIQGIAESLVNDQE